jgi:membrane-bound serine protease (ClpP class)
MIFGAIKKICLPATVAICLLANGLSDASSQDVASVERQGFRVDIPLPLVGNEDETVRRQIEQIADSTSARDQRPVVVLVFQSAGQSASSKDAISTPGVKTRGSQFERSLSLARFLTSPSATRVRLIGYVPESIEGHAVLPLLACEEIYANANAEIGRASIDEKSVDATVEGAYRDVVNRRHLLPLPVVLSMLRSDIEVLNVRTTDGQSQIVTATEAEELRKSGAINREEILWPAGGLASYTGQALRESRWITTATDITELSALLRIPVTLKKARQIPKQWYPVLVKLMGDLNTSRVNQIIRGVNEAVQAKKANLFVVSLETNDINFQEASRLASYFADLDKEEVFTLGIITGEAMGPAALIPLACKDAVILQDASLNPMLNAGSSYSPRNSRTTRLILDNLEHETNRPASLMSVLLDKDITVKAYIDQTTGRRELFADWQEKVDANWLAKESVAGGGPIDREVALKYGLVDASHESMIAALGDFGITQTPEALKLPWLDAGIQRILAQGWVPRLLLTLGFFALMAELGSPGLGLGGLVAALSFLGFFWIEGLNGNVEWLEVLLFLAGLVALGVEIFILPGFGIFGISGLLMVLISVVLASQTFIWPTNSAQLHEVSINLFWVACLALSGMIGLLVMHKQIEKLPMFRWVALQPAGGLELDELEARESLVHWEHLLGQEGMTTTRLNPSGKAQFGRDIVAVVGSGRMIDEGTAVRVVEVRGNLVIVEQA